MRHLFCWKNCSYVRFVILSPDCDSFQLVREHFNMKKNENPSLKDQMRALERTRTGRLRAKQKIMDKIGSTNNQAKLLAEMRATSADILKPRESQDATQLDPRDGWLHNLKNKFTKDEIKYLDDEFENLSEISLPKLSHLVQQEFYRALKQLHIHELQVSAIGDL